MKYAGAFSVPRSKNENIVEEINQKSNADKFIIVCCNTNSTKNARDIATQLVKLKLAAAVQATSVESTYLWESRIRRNEELLLQIKTTMNAYEKVEKVLKSMHPYEIPSIWIIPIIGGSEDYLKWMSESIAK